MSAFLLCGCGIGKKYFAELKGAYHYDREDSILKKSPSEITWEDGELLEYLPEGKKTKALEYQILELALPKRNYATGEISDYRIHMAYTVHNGKLIFTEIPILYAPHKCFVLGNSTDSAVVEIGDGNAFLVNLADASAKKLYDDGDARTISISPDGKYLLYTSNMDIYCHDMESGTASKLMNFDGKEFFGWDMENYGSFLFREKSVSASSGKSIYSDIFRYSMASSKEDTFFSLDAGYVNYEPTGARHVYRPEKRQDETAIDIYDIYSGEAISVSAGEYSMIWHVELSESEEYAAFFGSYINADKMAIAEIVTVNTKTNSLVAHYEQGQGEYFIDSFEWLPDNVLAINFINTATPYRDLCRLHNIDH